MERHLSDEQIDELLQTAERVPKFESGRSALEEAYQHLDHCEICNQRLLAQERVMETLKFLGVDAPSPPGADCPPDKNVWLQIAAGIEMDALNPVLEHAAHCDHCGPLLREAVEDMTADLTPEEEARLGELVSSSEAWQRGMAVRLSQPQPPTRTEKLASEHRRSSLQQWFSPLRLGLAVALALVAVLGVYQFRSARNAGGGNGHEQGGVSAPASPVPEPQAENKNGTTPAASREVESQVASLVLEPGLTRGGGQLKRLALPEGTRSVRLSLPLREPAKGKLHESLLTVERKRIWSGVSDASRSQTNGSVLSIEIPASLLPPNDYLVEVSRESPQGSEVLESYVFRVTRPPAAQNPSSQGENP